jgi:hypothetical protein
MDRSMFVGAERHEILDSIICVIAVDVMDLDS